MLDAICWPAMRYKANHLHRVRMKTAPAQLIRLVSGGLLAPGARAQSRPGSIDVFLQDRMQRLHIPGLQAAAIRHGQLVKLSSYLPDLPSAWQAVTLQQVLTNTSGLPNVIDEFEQVLAGGQEAAARKRRLGSKSKPCRWNLTRREVQLQPDRVRPAGQNHYPGERRAFHQIH